MDLYIEKRMLRCSVSKNGRNRKGRIVVRHKGGGLKLKRFMFSKKNIVSCYGFIFYKITANRKQADYGLIYYDIGIIMPILLEASVEEGMCIENFKKNYVIKRGSKNYLFNFYIGQLIYDVSLVPAGIGKYIKTAGNYATIFAKIGERVYIKMRSGWVIELSAWCTASMGIVSVRKKINNKNAGLLRNWNKRPTVRGVAMNPVDHPHGGGEGKKNPKTPKTPWGRITKGYITNRKKKFLQKKKLLKVF